MFKLPIFSARQIQIFLKLKFLDVPKFGNLMKWVLIFQVVKQAIRSMWDLDYEIEDIQKKFLDHIGGINLENLTDDFIEDVMLQSKPLQGVLLCIRGRQKV